MSETPAAAVCIELAMLLSMAGLADGLALQYHVSGLRSASRARSWLDVSTKKNPQLDGMLIFLLSFHRKCP